MSTFAPDPMTMASDEDRLVQETWELTIPGRVAVLVHVSGGVTRTLSRKGVGQRLRLTAFDRKVTQEQIRDVNNDPFTNGMLVRVDQAGAVETRGKSTNELDDTELAGLFKLDDEDFATYVDGLTEVNVRRLKALARKSKATTTQVEILDSTIEQKWPIGGDTPSNKEVRGDR